MDRQAGAPRLSFVLPSDTSIRRPTAAIPDKFARIGRLSALPVIY